MQTTESDGNKKLPVREILSNTLLAAIIGGAVTYFFLSGSPEKALESGARSGSPLAGGVGVLGFFGILFWNMMISLLGAFASGLVVAVISLIFYSRSKEKIDPTSSS